MLQYVCSLPERTCLYTRYPTPDTPYKTHLKRIQTETYFCVLCYTVFGLCITDVYQYTRSVTADVFTGDVLEMFAGSVSGMCHCGSVSMYVYEL